LITVTAASVSTTVASENAVEAAGLVIVKYRLLDDVRPVTLSGWDCVPLNDPVALFVGMLQSSVTPERTDDGAATAPDP
jgi:hypothetical protein